MNSSVLHFTQQSHLPIKKKVQTMIKISICAYVFMAAEKKYVICVFRKCF